MRRSKQRTSSATRLGGPLAGAKPQGEGRIAKANEATALLAKARVVFQEGLRAVE